MKIIKFDDSSMYWSKYAQITGFFLEDAVERIRDLARYRGYIYLNQIYEILGVDWDSRMPNPVFTGDGTTCKEIDICFSHVDGSKNWYVYVN